MMHIAILGSRGIPNQYGGFEQFAQQLAVYLVQQGHRVTVYNSSLHPYRDSNYQGVQIVRCYDPENYLGTAGQFIYDLLGILHARRQSYDVLLQLGYTSSALWYPLHPACIPVVTNMDGLEWRRSKYRGMVRRFLRWSEGRAAHRSQALVADSKGIAQYLQETYGLDSTFIPYAALPVDPLPSEKLAQALEPMGLVPGGYDLLIARMEPDNHIHTLLQAHAHAAGLRPSLPPLVLVGRPANAFARGLQARHPNSPHTRWLGGIYEQDTLEILRQGCRLYFHGHSVGGTNPSLLEAMASGCRIVAHNNEFNRSVLGEEAVYFDEAASLGRYLAEDKPWPASWPAKHRQTITEQYSPERIMGAYLHLLQQCAKPS